MTVLEMRDIKTVGQLSRRSIECLDSVQIRADRTAIDAERQRTQRMTEQRTLDVDQRQYSFDRPIAFRAQVVTAMPQAVLDDTFPAGAMKESRFGTTIDELIPLGKAPLVEFADAQIVWQSQGTF